jgi:hypothetical protein
MQQTAKSEAVANSPLTDDVSSGKRPYAYCNYTGSEIYVSQECFIFKRSNKRKLLDSQLNIISLNEHFNEYFAKNMNGLCGNVSSANSRLIYQSSSGSLKNFGGERMITSSQFMPSPFPALDAYILRAGASRGGIIGELAGFSLYYIPSTQDNWPHTFKLRYNVNKNRYCENVGRQHKSNHIILEVNLNYGVFNQLCWDPECKSYRSPSNRIDQAILPSLGELYELALDADILRLST